MRGKRFASTSECADFQRVVELRTRGDQRAADTLNAAITARENFHRWSAS